MHVHLNIARKPVSFINFSLNMQDPAFAPTGCCSASMLTLDDSFTSIHSVPLDLSTDEIHPSDTEDISGTDSGDSDEFTVDEEEAEVEVEGSTLSTGFEPPAWSGYVIVGDNVDKNIRHSFQRVDYKTQSLHYFNAYAVLDQIDFSGLSDEAPCTAVDPKSILPTLDDACTLEWEFQVLVSR